MKTVDNYLDLIKEKHGVKSDYALAKFMEIGHGRVTSYRTHRAAFSTEICLKVAALLEIDPMEVIAAMNAKREKDEGSQTFWKNTYTRISGAAVGVILSSGTALAFTAINAMGNMGAVGYILC